MTEEVGKGSFDEHHERAGYALIVVGLLAFLASSGAAIAVVGGWSLGPVVDVKPYVWLASLSVALAGFGTWTLVGVQRYRGIALKGPGGTSLEIPGGEKEA